MTDDEPADPATKFDACAAQVTAPVERLDNRPSIADLQNHLECHQAGCWIDAQKPIMEASPVLLEIAAAALMMRETEDALADAERDIDLHSERACDALHRFHLALSKVKP